MFQAFDRVREKYPGSIESKIIPLAGDLLEENIGLSEESEEIIKREVSVMFHSAASVRFDDPFTLAIKQNTLGAKKIVNLALKISKLAVSLLVILNKNVIDFISINGGSSIKFFI